MTTGSVKFFNLAKKFGFITPDGGGKDLYFPSSAVPADGVAKLIAGRRVSFDREADPKGDKAANLILLEERVAVVAPVARQNLTVYFDPASPELHAVEAAVRARTDAPVLIDYAATPLTVDQLKRLSLLLAATGQSLVRRYHPMFLDLRLDDRFIGEAEYWTAVAEHPVLIHGPIVVAGNRAGICQSQQDVAALFDSAPAAEAERKPKEISARLAAMMNGQPVASLPAAPLPKAPAASPPPAPETPSPVLPKPVSRPAAVTIKPAAKPQTTKVTLTVKKAAPAQAAPPKAAAKTAAKPPVKPEKKAVKPAAKVVKKSKPPAKAKKK